MFKSQGKRKRLDGVAVVSAIMAAESPKAAAQALRRLATEPPGFINGGRPHPFKEVDDLLRQANNVIKDLGAKHPLCHNMTNLVVQNFAANVALSM